MSSPSGSPVADDGRVSGGHPIARAVVLSDPATWRRWSPGGASAERAGTAGRICWLARLDCETIAPVRRDVSAGSSSRRFSPRRMKPRRKRPASPHLDPRGAIWPNLVNKKGSRASADDVMAGRSSSHQASLKAGVQVVARAWVDQTLTKLRADQRAATGAWPGTLSEARHRVVVMLLPWLREQGLGTEVVLDNTEAARLINSEARNAWLSQREADDGS